MVCPSTLLPALDFREEEAPWEQALGSPAWCCYLTSPLPLPLRDLAHLPMSISLPGWGCKGQLWLRGRAGRVCTPASGLFPILHMLWHHHGKLEGGPGRPVQGILGRTGEGCPCPDGLSHLLGSPASSTCKEVDSYSIIELGLAPK